MFGPCPIRNHRISFFRPYPRDVMRPTVACSAILSYYLYQASNVLCFKKYIVWASYSVKICSDMRWGNNGARSQCQYSSWVPGHMCQPRHSFSSFRLIFRSQDHLCNKIGRVGFRVPWQTPPVVPGCGPHHLKNRNNGDIVPPGGVAVKHYTTPPSRQ